MALPALQVRVPNPANALLQAEQIKGARAQTRAFQQQEVGRNALLSAFQTNDFRTPEGRNAIVGQVGQTAPLRAIQLQETFGRLSTQEQAQTARESALIARGFVNVRDQASYDQARSVLQQNGVDVSKMPAQFNPAYVQSAVQVAQSIDSLTVSAGTAAQIAAGDRRATLPTPPLSADRQQQELAQIEARQTPAAGFALSPGQTRFDAQGDPIASLPTTPPRPTQRQADVAALAARGFSRQQSEDIAAGRVRVSTDPVTGETTLVNVATGTADPVRPTQGPTITSEERGRLFNQNAAIERVLGLSEGLEESAASAAGPRGSLGAIANTFAGFLGREAPIPADEIAAARQDIRLFNQIAKTAIVNNPRFPVAEQQIVERMLPNANDFFANPSVEFNKVLQLQEFLRSLQIENNTSLGVTDDLSADEQAELERLRASQGNR